MSLNLSALNFFRSLRLDNRQFAVIGLGRFGCAICKTLNKSGYEVLGIDNDEELVDQVLNESIVAHALQLDATDPKALKEAGVFEFDIVIVAIGNYVEESIITVLNLKEAGVRHVVAKASGVIHDKLLKRVGADHVVFPEDDMGRALARSLTRRPAILDCFELDPDHSIAEITVPDVFDGKTIVELELRSRFDVTVLAVKQQEKFQTNPDQDKIDLGGEAEEVKQQEKFQINPDPNLRLSQGAVMVLIGTNKGIDRLPL